LKPENNNYFLFSIFSLFGIFYYSFFSN